MRTSRQRPVSQPADEETYQRGSLEEAPQGEPAEQVTSRQVRWGRERDDSGRGKSECKGGPACPTLDLG